jgi:hypothetical protein
MKWYIFDSWHEGLTRFKASSREEANNKAQNFLNWEWTDTDFLREEEITSENENLTEGYFNE